MPYYIVQGCDGKPDWWAVKDIAGEQFGCHATKQDAIDQGVAISLSDGEDFIGERALPDLSAPAYMREAADKGVKWFEDGLAGDGVTAQTVREARLMASGDVSLAKWRRVSAWIARHLVDLDAPDADPDSDGYPSPGVVAHALWGSDGGKDGALRVKEYADNLLMRVDAENRAGVESGEPIIICDIDDTLIHAGMRVDKVWEFVEAQPGAVFIVTGRPESARANTEAELEDLDIEYSRLLMNSESTADSTEFKKMVAESLLETYNVLLAVENNPDTLAMYRELGIESIDPADIPALSESQDMGERFAKLGVYTAKGVGVKTFESRISAVEFELRDTGDGMTFEGYAAIFDSPSQPLPFVERIAPGAFTRSLKARNDIKLLWNHDSSIVLGSTRAKTLVLTEDEKGLKVRASLPNTTAGRDAAELIKRGDVNAMSFGFTVPPKGDVWNADGTERTLKNVGLHEVSIVAWPAYSATSGTASVRSFIRTAQRAEVDADALAEALVKLEAGEDISADDRNLLNTVIEKLGPAEVAEDSVGDMARLALKRKKLELLKGFSA